MPAVGADGSVDPLLVRPTRVPRTRAPDQVSEVGDLAGAELPGIFNGRVAAAVAPYYLGYTLTSWNPLYHLYGAPSEAFRQPWAARVPQLFNGSHQDQQILATLPTTLSRLLTPAYLRLMQHPTGNFLRALNANSTCAGWTPRVPVRLYAASGDSTVTPVNALRCVQAFQARGGDASLIQLGSVARYGPVSHDIGAFLGLPKVVRWFASWPSR